MSTPHPVVVVGAGPAGLMLALELRVRGVEVVVLERTRERPEQLRALGLTHRTLEALRRRGLLDTLIAQAGAGTTWPPPAVEPAREPALHPEAVPALGESAETPPFLAIRQERVEEVLEDRLGTRVRRGITVTGLEGDRHLAVCGVDDTGAAVRVPASWVVGCDGGHSAVRRAGGFAFEGDAPTMHGYQALVDVDPPDALRPGWHRTATGVISYATDPSRVVSLEFDGPGPDRENPVTLDEVGASVRRTSGQEVRLAAPRSLTRFTDNARVARPYRSGRVLLAGDAAHVHPPFGGHGLNLSMLDAVNLGWKLAAVVTGQAPPALLDTYEAERRPAALAAVRNARAQAALWDPRPEVTPLHDLFRELRADPAVAERVHRTFSQTRLRYDLGARHDLVGRVAPDALLCVDGRVTRLSTLLSDGRAVLLDLGDATGPGDVPATRVRALAATPLAPVDDELADVARVLVRPDGVVAALATTDGAVDPHDPLEAARRWPR